MVLFQRKKNSILHHNYSRFFHTLNTILFTILSAIKQIKCHFFSRVIFTKVSLFELLDGGDDGEPSGAAFVEISKIHVMWDVYFPLECNYLTELTVHCCTLAIHSASLKIPFKVSKFEIYYLNGYGMFMQVIKILEWKLLVTMKYCTERMCEMSWEPHPRPKIYFAVKYLHRTAHMGDINSSMHQDSPSGRTHEGHECVRPPGPSRCILLLIWHTRVVLYLSHDIISRRMIDTP